MIILENNEIIIKINLKGAELKSLFNKVTEQEYIWPGISGTFKKSAPNLFPFIGNIKNGEINYFYNGEVITKPMTKHGFARDLEFVLISQTKTSATFELTENEYTKNMYPYNFSLKVIYEILENKVFHKYIVKNLDTNTMFYHIGGHTAFNCNFNGDSDFSNYYLEFEKDNCKQYMIDPINNSYIDENFEEIKLNGKWDLNKNKFEKDALVFIGLKNNYLNIKHINSNHGIKFSYKNLPILTLWTNLDSSNFICLEPWAGITDFSTGDINVENKPFIESLNPFQEKEFIQIIETY